MKDSQVDVTVKPAINTDTEGAIESVCIIIKINFLLTISLDYHEQSLWELTKWSQIEKYLIFYQILLTNSSRKCMEISLENLYVDIGA